jgi:acetyl-CoA carboxylase biotin carboxyl carrier protein
LNLTHNDVKTILEIVDRAEHLDEIELVFAGLKLHVRRSGGEPMARSSSPVSRSAASPAAAPVAALQPTASAKAAAAELAPNEIALRAPMLGTFYRAASPGDKPFVEVGQRVKADDTVCVIEVMKLFNNIRAGVDGTVVRIEAQNAQLVEYDAPLVIIAKD